MATSPGASARAARRDHHHVDAAAPQRHARARRGRRHPALSERIHRHRQRHLSSVEARCQRPRTATVRGLLSTPRCTRSRRRSSTRRDLSSSTPNGRHRRPTRPAFRCHRPDPERQPDRSPPHRNRRILALYGEHLIDASLEGRRSAGSKPECTTGYHVTPSWSKRLVATCRIELDRFVHPDDRHGRSNRLGVGRLGAGRLRGGQRGSGLGGGDGLARLRGGGCLIIGPAGTGGDDASEYHSGDAGAGATIGAGHAGSTLRRINRFP